MKTLLQALVISGSLLLWGPVFAGDTAAGQVLSEDCADCHGDDISGWADAEFIAVMKEYQDGTRQHKMMAKLAKGMSEEDLANLAAYYATISAE